MLISPGVPLLLVADDTPSNAAVARSTALGDTTTRPQRTAATGRRTSWGNNWMVIGVLTRVPIVPHRMLYLPVLA
jgi:hypothetical protein